MNKILIIQTAYLGDVILATALVEALHVQFPEASIHMLVRQGAEGLLKNHPYIQSVMVFDKQQARYKQLFSLLKTIRKSRYDLVVNCHRFASSGFLAAFSGAGIISGFRKNPFSRFFHHRYEHEIGNGMHEIRRNQKLLSFLGAEGDFRPKLYPAELKEIPSGPYVCIAPASVWFTKQWPAHKWVELIREIPDNIVVYLLGSKSDFALCEQIKTASGRADVVNYCGKLDLLQSAAFMQQAQMNYVNDSAPLHLCSAVNAPVTAVFCSTVPDFGFGPLSDRSHIVEIPEKLACRPCGLHGYKACPEGHFRCAEGIAVEKVV